MYKKIYSFFILCITCVLPLFGSDAKIIVGTNAEFPPFTFIDKGEVVGFDIDVAKEVCKRLGKEMQLKDMPFDALVPELTLGYVQFVAAGMSHTEERAKRVLFTKSYGSNDPLVILTLTKKMSLDDLTGKTVVVNEGFTADLFMSSKPGITLVRLSTPVDAFLALKAGRADAYVTAKSTIQQ
ncbi:MAG: artP, partial [Chlamydiia bacterium]|nr:artP [Chlamydiia bacterium]